MDAIVMTRSMMTSLMLMTVWQVLLSCQIRVQPAKVATSQVSRADLMPLEAEKETGQERQEGNDLRRLSE